MGLLLGGLIASTALGVLSQANKYGVEAYKHNNEMEKVQKEYENQSALAEQQFGYDSNLAQQKSDLDLRNQSANNQQQYELERAKRQSEYQDTVQSMSEAGLNPALAYSGGLTQSGGELAQPSEQPTNARQNAQPKIKDIIQTAFMEAYLKGASAKIEQWAKKNNIKAIKHTFNSALNVARMR